MVPQKGSTRMTIVLTTIFHIYNNRLNNWKMSNKVLNTNCEEGDFDPYDCTYDEDISVLIYGP